MGNSTQNKEYKVLDKGFVRVVDVMGTDSSIVQAARISYGSGVKTPEQDRALIRYLMRNRHTSPFEMCEIKFHLKMPFIIGKQCIRHRTANINEYSGRYSEMIKEFYIPSLENIGVQSSSHKQGRGEALETEKAKEIQDLFQKHCQETYELYENLLQKGLAKELARMVLPTNIYTEFYWKIDLHNLFHFLNVRLHPGAQFEMQEYARVIAEIVKEYFPVSFEAFLDYRKNSVNVAGNVKDCLQRNGKEPTGLGKTELEEFYENWN